MVTRRAINNQFDVMCTASNQFTESSRLIRERAQFDFMPLSERPDAIPQVARWWCLEWGLPQRHESMESYLSELASLKPGKLPIHLLALSERNIVGVATLKDQSALHKLFPDFQYWLSGVYVPPALRSRGIATALCLKMVDIAKTIFFLMMRLPPKSTLFPYRRED